MMRGKSPRSDVEMSKKTKFRDGHLGFFSLYGNNQLYQFWYFYQSERSIHQLS